MPEATRLEAIRCELSNACRGARAQRVHLTLVKLRQFSLTFLLTLQRFFAIGKGS